MAAGATVYALDGALKPGHTNSTKVAEALTPQGLVRPASPMDPDGVAPAELQERIAADRVGEPYLLFRDGEGAQRIFTLANAAERLTIGRAPGCELPLPWDEGISRAHAQVERLGGGDWALLDDGLSRNGSFVNGERLRQRGGWPTATCCASATRSWCSARRWGRWARRSRCGTSTEVPVISPAQRRVLIALCRPFRDGDDFSTPASNQDIADELVLSVERSRPTCARCSSASRWATCPAGEARRAGEARLPDRRDLARATWSRAPRGGPVPPQGAWAGGPPRPTEHARMLKATLTSIAAALLLALPGSALAAPAVTGEFPVSEMPKNLTQGPDGNIWATIGGKIARVTPAGVVTEFDPANVDSPFGITTGPDGNLWVTQSGGVAKLSTADPNSAEKFAVGDITDPRAITTGPDGNLWTASGDDVVKIPPANPTAFTPYPVAGLSARDIASGGDGQLWVADLDGKRIISVTTAGTTKFYPVGGGVQGVVAGPGTQIAYASPSAPQHVGRLPRRRAAEDQHRR